MFINISNHGSDRWGKKQLQMAEKFGKIIDVPFPKINPRGTSAYIDELVEEYYEKIMQYDHPTVMLQGEYLFTYRLVKKLKDAGVRVVAGCSERRTIECINEAGFTERNSVFEFVDFKEY